MAMCQTDSKKMLMMSARELGNSERNRERKKNVKCSDAHLIVLTPSSTHEFELTVGYDPFECVSSGLILMHGKIRISGARGRGQCQLQCGLPVNMYTSLRVLSFHTLQKHVVYNGNGSIHEFKRII